ncbi:hypothetical protein [Pontibacter oryzae]|nr:hypothetical protein [Pontibacter oryzae]
MSLHSLFHVGLPVNDEYLLLGQQQVSVIVAEVVGVAGFGPVEVGEVAEVESCHFKYLPVDGGFTLRAGLPENGAVAAQGGIDADHQLFSLVLLPLGVVGLGTALVGAKSLVGPAA